MITDRRNVPSMATTVLRGKRPQAPPDPPSPINDLTERHADLQTFFSGRHGRWLSDWPALFGTFTGVGNRGCRTSVNHGPRPNLSASSIRRTALPVAFGGGPCRNCVRCGFVSLPFRGRSRRQVCPVEPRQTAHDSQSRQSFRSPASGVNSGEQGFDVVFAVGAVRVTCT